MSGEEDLYYNMDRARLGLAIILNNLDKEQEPTKKDVEMMGSVLRDIGQTISQSNKIIKLRFLQDLRSRFIGTSRARE